MIKAILRAIKNFIRKYFVRVNVVKRPAIDYCIENELLPSILVKTPSNALRKSFNLPVSEYCTQLNQDVFALLMNRFRSGYFLEIGANDGFTLSNTVYLENNFGWNGILIEANEKYMDSLRKRSNSKVFNNAVSYTTGKAEFIDAGLYGGLESCIETGGRHDSVTRNAPRITVDCMSLNEILNKAEAPETIDFVSIDVEGGELPIVEQLVSVDRRFRCGCIEYNNRIEDYRRMSVLLNDAGYSVVWNGQTKQDLFFIDKHL